MINRFIENIYIHMDTIMYVNIRIRPLGPEGFTISMPLDFEVDMIRVDNVKLNGAQIAVDRLLHLYDVDVEFIEGTAHVTTKTFRAKDPVVPSEPTTKLASNRFAGPEVHVSECVGIVEKDDEDGVLVRVDGNCVQ